MADLLAFVEQDLQTEFALLSAEQGPDECNTQTFAASGQGIVGMLCGNKYSELRVRLERWDARPPFPEEDWEDSDELPWSAWADAGTLWICGFDEDHDKPGLPVDGLDRARVEVLARGRHRYGYSDLTEGLPREEWLLRFWPDPDARDALAGPSRRVAGPLHLAAPGSAWYRALRAWDEAGWHPCLRGLPAYQLVWPVLGRLGQPFTEADVARFGAGDDDSWTSPQPSRSYDPAR